MELRLLRGAPAAFAGDELIAPAGERPNDNRLNNAAFGDRTGEFGERFLVETAARLIGMRLDRGDRETREALAGHDGRPVFPGLVIARARDQRLFAPRLAEQRTESAAELAADGGTRIGARDWPGGDVVLGAHAAFLSCGRRPISSRASVMYARLPAHE